MQTPSDVLKKIAESGGRDYPQQFTKSVRFTQLAGLQVVSVLLEYLQQLVVGRRFEQPKCRAHQWH